MSYSISLVHPVTLQPLELAAPHQMRGGTYCVEGEATASLNITFNYAAAFAKAFGCEAEVLTPFHRVFGGGEKGLRSIYGKTGAESLPLLDAAIARLGDDVDPNYWAATEGNAKAALLQLKALATLRPDGVWAGD